MSKRQKLLTWQGQTKVKRVARRCRCCFFLCGPLYSLQVGKIACQACHNTTSEGPQKKEGAQSLSETSHHTRRPSSTLLSVTRFKRPALRGCGLSSRSRNRTTHVGEVLPTRPEAYEHPILAPCVFEHRRVATHRFPVPVRPRHHPLHRRLGREGVRPRFVGQVFGCGCLPSCVKRDDLDAGGGSSPCRAVPLAWTSSTYPFTPLRTVSDACLECVARTPSTIVRTRSPPSSSSCSYGSSSRPRLWWCPAADSALPPLLRVWQPQGWTSPTRSPPRLSWA